MHFESGKLRATGVAHYAAIAAAAGTMVVLAACGPDGTGAAPPLAGGPNASGASAPAATKSASSAPAPKLNRVIVNETEYRLGLSVSAYHPGNYAFTLRDGGHAPHALTINGPGIHSVTSSTVKPGQTTDLIVPLVKGTYELWSPIGSDKVHGMTARITVT